MVIHSDARGNRSEEPAARCPRGMASVKRSFPELVTDGRLMPRPDGQRDPGTRATTCRRGHRRRPTRRSAGAARSGDPGCRGTTVRSPSAARTPTTRTPIGSSTDPVRQKRWRSPERCGYACFSLGAVGVEHRPSDSWGRRFGHRLGCWLTSHAATRVGISKFEGQSCARS